MHRRYTCECGLTIDYAAAGQLPKRCPDCRSKPRPCVVPGCVRTTPSNRGNVACPMHAKRLAETGDYGPALAYHEMPRPSCEVDGCERVARIKSMCQTHWTRWRKTGSAGPPHLLKAAPGSGYINTAGYRVLKVDGRTIGEHRLVMERILGRMLWPDENVHHINGDRADNRPENLELWSTAQPAGQRVEDKVAWAKELLLRYEPEALTVYSENAAALRRVRAV